MSMQWRKLAHLLYSANQDQATVKNTMSIIIIIIIIINPCKPYLTASAPRLTHWGGGK
jgi:hypothetical protein